MHSKKILIAGGTGFIGQALAARFGKDNQVIILSRQDSSPNNRYHQPLLQTVGDNPVSYLYWDGIHASGQWIRAIDACDLVINLSGKSVNCRYTEKNKQEIFDSRTNATAAIGEAICLVPTPPKLWINAASATIYRHAEDRPQDEYTGELQDGFSVQVCKKWERSFFDQRTPSTRKIALRMAITLGEAGVMIPYCNLLKYGLGGKQGTGRQMYSWLHIEDLGRVIEWMVGHTEMEGVYNVCSPHPVTNSSFMKTLRQSTGYRIGLPAPVWMLKIGAALIGTETELILKSRWVLPTKLQETGFEFQYGSLEDALREIITRMPRRRYRLF